MFKALFPMRNLTKKYLMSLPEGVFLVSNARWTPLDPLFMETVGPLSEREDQWQRVKAVRRDQTPCWVYANRADFEEEAQELQKSHEQRMAASRRHGRER